MRRADHIIDLGPGAGVHGGKVVAAGTLTELAKHPESVTGQCLRAEKKFPSRGERRQVSGKVSNRVNGTTSRVTSPTHPLTHLPNTKWLTLHGASAHNLKNLTVQIPLGCLVLVTGV